MKLKEFDIRLDIKRSQKHDYIEVVQGDYETNILNIQITENLQPYNLTGLSVEIAFAKPDNTTVLQDEDNGVTIEDAEQGKIKVVLKTNTIAAAGKVYAEVRIKDGDMILTTARFDFFVRRAIFGDDTIKSKDEWPLYEQLLEAAENENERIDNENTRIQNETQRENQEIIRQQNEQDRTTAESARNVAESDRQTNEQSRINNESIRQQQESDRMVNEQERINAEEQRISAESERLSAENERISREQERINAEEQRISAESERLSAENERISREQERIENENTRISNETTRQSNEQARINAELERQTNEQLRREQEDYRQASIADIENRWNQLTTAQQQDAEVIDARTSTIKEKTFPTLNARLEEIEQDVNKPVYSDTITIEGGIGSIPSNAEGQISVSVKGRTLFNHVNNGIDYANWSIQGTGTTKGSNGIHLVQSSSPFDFARLNINLQPNKEYTLIINIKAKTGTVNLLQDSSSVFGKIIGEMADNLGINKFKFTTPTTITYNRLYFFVNGNEGDYVDFEVYAILEGDYTIDNSVNYPMSYGTKSTLSAFRIRSVSEDESQESVVYVLAKDDEGNIEELRSLPNGTKDEINVTDRKLIKRIGEKSNIANGMEIDFADMAEGGTYYAWNEDGETETGIKGDTLGIDATTLIYQLAEPITYPVNIEGEVIAYPNGTVYIEPYIADMFEYNDGITFDYPVSEIDKIKGIVDGKWVELDNEYTLSEDGLTLTIEGVENGQQIKVYAPIQEGESTIGTLDITVPCNLKAQVRGNTKMVQLAHDKIVDLNDFTVAMLLNHEIRLTALEMQGGN